MNSARNQFPLLFWLLSQPRTTTTATDAGGSQNTESTTDGGAGAIGALVSITDFGSSQQSALSPQTYTTVYDSNGNITELLDGSGNVAANYTYAAFGGLLSATGPAADICPFGWQTMYRDSETGLISFPMRDYSTELDRWMTPDPSGEKSGLNIDAYCGNDPINKNDPTGLEDVSRGHEPNFLLKKSNELGNRGDFWGLLGSMVYGVPGGILEIFNSAPYLYGQTKTGLAQARQDIAEKTNSGEYSMGQAALARFGLFTGGFGAGTTFLVLDSQESVPDFIHGTASLLPQAQSHFYQFGLNPSPNGFFDVAEDSVAIGLLAAPLKGLKAPMENFAAKTYFEVVSPESAASLYESNVLGTARLKFEFPRDVFRAANNEAQAAAGRFASIEMPLSPSDAIRGNALNPSLMSTPNLASELFVVRTHLGLSVEGMVAAQGEGFPGGFTQVFQTRMSSGSPWVGRPQLVPYPVQSIPR